jgi:voltage-gated potassium channel
MNPTLRKFIRYYKKHAMIQILGAIVIIWIFGSIGMWLAEPGGSHFRNLPHAFWNLIVYLTSGFEGDQPVTTLGKGIGVVVVILGLALIGLFTATIASMFVKKTLREEKGMGTVRLEGHIVICGWNEQTDGIIKQLHAPVVKRDRKPIVIITDELSQLNKDDPAYDDVYFIAGDPSDANSLRRANVTGACMALILADRKNPEQADSKSIFIALAIEAMSKRVHTCVEIMNPKNVGHFKYVKVDECISKEHIGELILSQAALKPGISTFYTELLTNQEEGKEIYVVNVPESIVGKKFGEVATLLLKYDMIAVGMNCPDQESCRLNVRVGPTYDTIISQGDRLYIISMQDPDIDNICFE